MNILEIKRLTLGFGKLLAVHDLSFDVEKGEIFGIAGPNGAGKTTVFNLITGFYHGSGDILFEDKKINGLPPYVICRKGIGRTFQIPQLFNTLTVKENVRVGAHFGNSNLKNENINIREAINLAGLEGKEEIYAENLNLFDKKMTMLAAALATKPKLFLLDEPVGGLTPKEIEQSMELFRRMNSELGLTIIIIEHVMKALAEISNRIMILSDGQKVCLGHPQVVCQDENVIKLYLGTGV